VAALRQEGGRELERRPDDAASQLRELRDEQRILVLDLLLARQHRAAALLVLVEELAQLVAQVVRHCAILDALRGPFRG
jgi:hypothetical protein